jgi:hypothetical protein
LIREFDSVDDRKERKFQPQLQGLIPHRSGN